MKSAGLVVPLALVVLFVIVTMLVKASGGSGEEVDRSEANRLEVTDGDVRRVSSRVGSATEVDRTPMPSASENSDAESFASSVDADLGHDILPEDERNRIKDDLFRETLPEASVLAAHAAINPHQLELTEDELNHLDVLIDSLNAQSFELSQRESELVDRFVEEKIERSQYIQVGDDPEPFSIPRGAVAFSRMEKGKPGIRVLLHSGEFPALDGVRDSRRELASHSRTLVDAYFDR